MNQQQFESWVKTTLGLVAGYAIARGWGNSDLWVMIGGLVMAAVPFFWGWFSHTKLAMVQQAAALPEVEHVLISPDAKGDLQIAARDQIQTVNAKIVKP